MKLELGNLKSAAGAKKRKKRVGRGNASGHGTYSCRGGKGQTARSGVSGLAHLGFRDTLRRIPKVRGFKSFAPHCAVIDLDVLSKHYKDGEKVSIETLHSRGLIGRIDKKNRGVKILGGGELTKKLIFEGVKFSKSALEKTKQAGGEIIEPKKS
ncbi:MAG: 50S ribosomal protein L15 [Patescibacteria group bacterium]|nr:50S ribosomal protein L15 [Patescibacteria group bacterium]